MSGLQEPPTRSRPTRILIRILPLALLVLAVGAAVWTSVTNQRMDLIEDVPAREVDLVLVPGLAFDRTGHRLGHGQGYFDRFLARLPRSTPTVGLAYRFQLLDRLPRAAHDHPVQAVLTA